MTALANRKSGLRGVFQAAAGACLAGLALIPLAACHGGGYAASPGNPAAPGTPTVLTLSAPSTMAAGTVQVASAQVNGPSAYFRWSIQGGVFPGGLAAPTTPAVAFTAAVPGPLVLTCTVVDAAGGTVLPPQSLTIQVGPANPGGLAIQAPAYATAGLGGYTAAVTAPRNGATYTWTIDGGGTLTGSTQGTSVTFTAGPGPVLNLTCTATDAATATAAVAVAVVAPPQPPVITPSATTVTPGSNLFATVVEAPGSTYRWTLAGGVFAGGFSELTTPVAAFTAGPVGTLGLTCATVNAAGTASAATPCQIAIVPPVSTAQPALQAPLWASAGAGGLTATVTNFDAAQTYRWTIAGGTFAGPTQTPGGQTVTFQAGPGPGGVTLACTATSAAGVASLPGTAGVGIAALPDVPVVQAPAQATAGVPQVAYVQGRAGERYQWTIRGGAFNGATQTPIATTVAFTSAAGEGLVELFCTALNSAGAASAMPGFAGVAILPPADQPILAVDTPFAFTGVAGNAARVVGAQPTLTYDWTLQGGVLTSPAQGPVVTFTAGPGPTLTLTCTATTAAGAVSLPGSIGVPVGAAPTVPVITALAEVAPASQQVAWVPGQPNATYQWTVPAGITVLGADTGPVLVYQAGPAGTLILGCTVTVGGQTLAAAPFHQTVAAVPDAPVLQTTTPWVTTGAAGNASVAGGGAAGTVYAWTIQGGTFAGGGVTAQGAAVAFTAGPGGADPAVSLACTATAPNGTPSLPGTLAVGIANLPPTPALDAPAYFTAGAGPVRAQVVNPLADMTYDWRIAGGTFSDGTLAATGLTVLLDGTAVGQRTLTCTARNRAGTACTEAGTTLTVGVAPSALPQVTLPPVWTVGNAGLQATGIPPAGTTLLWQIQGGTFLGGAASLAGAAAGIDAAAPAGARMIVCQAVNAAGGLSAPVVKVVELVPAPVIESFGLAPGVAALYQGQLGWLAATFTGGTGEVTGADTLPVTSGQPFLVQRPVVSPTDWVLTVTNPAGTAVSQAFSIPVQTATATVAFVPDQAEEIVVPYQPVTLTWAVTGVPARLSLNLVGGAANLWPVDVLGRTSFTVPPATGRQTYQLVSVDPLGETTATLTTVAPGLSLLAGDAVDFTSAFMSGPVSSTAAWRSVAGLAVNDDGDALVAEAEDHTLRTINSDTGRAALLAGLRGNPDSARFPAETARFATPEGVAVLPDGATILVADSGTHTIKQVTAGGAVTVYAGQLYIGGDVDSAPGVQGLLDEPDYLAVDRASGYAFVTEPGSRQLRMIAPDGSITTLAAVPQGDGVLGVAVDAASNVYVGDTTQKALYRLTPDRRPLDPATTWTSARFAPAVAFRFPAGMCVGTDPADGQEYLFVADSGAHVIRKISLATGAGVVWAGTQGTPGWTDGLAALFDHPTQVAVGPGGTLYVADQTGTALRRIEPDEGTTTLGGGNDRLPSAGYADGTGSDARFSAPQGVVVASSGTTFVADSGNHVIRSITPQGVVTTFAGVAGQAGDQDGTGAGALFSDPQWLAIDPWDNLYVSETDAGRVRLITRQGVVLTLTRAVAAPQGVAVDAAGNVYIADRTSGDIVAWDPDTGQLVVVAPNANATALAFDVHGHLVALEPGARGVEWFSRTTPGQPWTGNEWFSWTPGAQDGYLSTVVAVLGGPEAQFDGPTRLIVDRGNNIYLADAGNGLVRKVAEDGSVTTVAGTYPNLWTVVGPPPGVLPGATAIALTPAGDLVVTAGDAVFTVTAP